MKEEYRLLSLPKIDLNKLLNRWTKEFKVYVIWLAQDNEDPTIFHALIKLREKRGK